MIDFQRLTKEVRG